MNIFDFRDQLIGDYSSYIKSFIQIRNSAIQSYTEQQLAKGILWPKPLIQLNPLFARGASIDELVAQGVLQRECARIFRKDKTEVDEQGQALHLHTHQEEAIRVARSGASYVLTTGTGPGKSLAYIIPIVDYVLRYGTGR
jgi:ATP-dependent helicase YprA (DUF1998 family)